MATMKKQKNKGLEQAQEIYKEFNAMDLKQKEAFLLGRISISLEIGNNMAEGLNNIIKESDGMLSSVRIELYSEKEKEDAVPKSVPRRKRATGTASSEKGTKTKN